MSGIRGPGFVCGGFAGEEVVPGDDRNEHRASEYAGEVATRPNTQGIVEPDGVGLELGASETASSVVAQPCPTADRPASSLATGTR